MEVFLLILSITILLLLLFGYVMHHNNKKFNVTCYTVVDSTIPEAFDEYKLVLLTDLHNYVYGKENCILLKAIEDQQPDGIMIAGDMLVKSDSLEYQLVFDLLAKLAASYPIYYANGNHEAKLEEQEETKQAYRNLYENPLKELGVIFLKNNAIRLQKDSDSMVIYGLNLDDSFYQKFKKSPLDKEVLNQMLGKAGPEYSILLAHNPVYFKEYVKWGAKLVLSGHVHGGLVNIPLLGGIMSTQGHLFPKYDAGMFEEEDATILLSRGLGNHTIHIRLFNRAELVVATLKRY